MLRAIILSSGTPVELQNVLNIVDERTLRRFLARCGFRKPYRSLDLSVGAFLRIQPLINGQANIDAVVAELERVGAFGNRAQ